MSVILISKAGDEAKAGVVVKIVKFVERIQIERTGDAFCFLEFIANVEAGSPKGLSKLDVIVPQDIAGVEDITDTFTDVNLFDNQQYTEDFRCLDQTQKKYYIDGIEAFLAEINKLSSSKLGNKISILRIKFQEIGPEESGAFRLKLRIPNFARIHNSLMIFELSLYYRMALPEHIEMIREWGVLGIPMERSLCEIWAVLPEETVFRWAIPNARMVKMDHTYSVLSNKKISPRSAVYWDLEDDIFDLPGRKLGNLIDPNKGVRIYCETNKPHVTPDNFDKEMTKAHESLKFIAKYGKLSFILTFIFSLFAIIIAVYF